MNFDNNSFQPNPSTPGSSTPNPQPTFSFTPGNPSEPQASSSKNTSTFTGDKSASGNPTFSFPGNRTESSSTSDRNNTNVNTGGTGSRKTANSGRPAPPAFLFPKTPIETTETRSPTRTNSTQSPETRPATPQPSTPGPFGSQPNSPNTFGSQSFGAQSPGAQPNSPNSFGTQPNSPNSFGTQSFGSQSPGVQPNSPNSFGTQSPGAQPNSPNSFGAQSFGTQSFGAQPGSPNSFGTQSFGAQSMLNSSGNNYSTGQKKARNSMHQKAQPPIKGIVILGGLIGLIVAVAAVILYSPSNEHYATIIEPESHLTDYQRKVEARKAENARRRAIKSERVEKARQELASFRADNAPKTPKNLAIEKAISLEDAGKHKEAIAAFEEAWKLDPTDAYPANQIALIYRTKLNNQRASIEWEKKVTQISKDTLKQVAEQNRIRQKQDDDNYLRRHGIKPDSAPQTSPQTNSSQK